MTENQKEALLEIQELLLAVNAVVKKYELEDEFISCLAVGFLDLDSSYIDEDGVTRSNMNLMSSISVADEEELDDLLSYCVESYQITEEEEKRESKDTSSIDYWINLAKGDDSVN
jgi:hypothetical protein